MRKLSSVRNTEIVTLRQRCEGLVARICLAEGNAQRLGAGALVIEPQQPIQRPVHVGHKERLRPVAASEPIVAYG